MDEQMLEVLRNRKRERVTEAPRDHGVVQSEVPEVALTSHTHASAQTKAKQSGKTTYPSIDRYLRDAKGDWHLWIALS